MDETKYIDESGAAFPINGGYADNQDNGLSKRDYFAAHAPPMPAEIREAYWLSLSVNEPDAVRLPWNEFVLARLATQEARWRFQYADAMLKRPSH